MRKVFPLSFKGKNFKAVLLSTVIYTLIFAVVAILLGCFSFSGNIAIAINIFKQFLLLYCASGIVIAILHACDLLDKKWFQ